MGDIASEDQRPQFALLCEVYRVSIGNTKMGLGPSNLRDCARRASLSGPAGDDALEWLVDEKLLARSEARGTIFITHAGVKEVEASFAHPGAATEHFAASVIQGAAPPRDG